MSTVQELKKRADELRKKTAVNSITPDEVGSLIFDTIDYMYSIESSGLFKMMSALAETDNPSVADQIPVIGAEIAQKASITTIVGKGLQNAETQTELDSVPVIRGTKVGQMAKTDIATKLCDVFEQNLPTYRPDIDTFDQVRIRKSETGEGYYISKEDLSKVVGELIGTVSLKEALDAVNLNDFTNGFAEAYDSCTNKPYEEAYGFIVAFKSEKRILQHFYDANAHKVYERIFFDAWRPWFALN